MDWTSLENLRKPNYQMKQHLVIFNLQYQETLKLQNLQGLDSRAIPTAYKV